LTGSAGFDYAGFFVSVDTSAFATSTPDNIEIDIAVGAFGSEQVILPNYYCRVDAGCLGGPNVSPFIALQIPAGTRVAARCATFNSSAAPGIVLSGVRQ
jgi:hypothetical protein